jgi:predicted O-linked N-acetylglucosamine transferase (SPINDLY family)
LGRFDEAISVYQQALAINPDYAEAHNNLGLTLHALGQYNDAAATCRRAIFLQPNFAEAHDNLGNALYELGQFDEAIISYSRALTINPQFAEAHNNLGCALKDSMQFSKALNSYRAALQINPNYSIAHSNLLFCLNHSETLDAQALFSEHLNFAKQFETPLRPNWPQHNNLRDPDRCLQVGFVSGDLRKHPVVDFLEPVLAQLALHPKLSLHAYYNHAVEDNVSQRLRKYFARWYSVIGLSDNELAKKIQTDNIDMLYDLSGHTGKNRLVTFSHKPAPVQISWIGYPNTSGLNAMDYYQSDSFFFPDHRFDNQFTEKIVRLPASSVFLPSEYSPLVNTLPALSNGYMTFGSFNRVSKISRSVVALWSQLLRALPNSRMLLGAMPQNDKHQLLLEWFAQEGISQDRLTFHTRSDMKAYLYLHHQVDMCLDTFPYGGGTTTFHALWMGLPTLTLTGQTMAGYAGASILGHVGLETFAAHNAIDFVQKGVFWSNHLTELSVIRAELRERFAKSARGRPDVVAAAMERALRVMWQRWCAGLPAESFEVTLQEAEDIISKGDQ